MSGLALSSNGRAFQAYLAGIQAVLANVTATEGRWATAGGSPLDALLAFQGDSGAFRACLLYTSRCV